MHEEALLRWKRATQHGGQWRHLHFVLREHAGFCFRVLIERERISASQVVTFVLPVNCFCDSGKLVSKILGNQNMMSRETTKSSTMCLHVSFVSLCTYNIEINMNIETLTSRDARAFVFDLPLFYSCAET